MTAQEFAYWLHGFTELTQGQTPNPAQWKSICEHLDLVFKKVTQPVGEVEQTITAPPGTDITEVMRKYFEAQKAPQETWRGILPFDWTKTVVTC